MPLSELDPTPALILIDLQKGITGIDAAHPMDEIITNAARVASEFRARKLPVVLVNVAGGAPGRTDASQAGTGSSPARPADWAEIVDELDVHADDMLITKLRWGAFHETGLHDELQSRGVTQVLLGGVATSIGVESTARAAHEHGYHVALITDAMTDANPKAHDHSVQVIFPRLGQTTTTEAAIGALRRR